MLQQTQVATVINYYHRWFAHFPTVRDLADANEASVLLAWQGLGYYQRARSLHQCAKTIVAQFDERFPSTVEELIKLPGVGRYTAGAIVSFAFDLPAPIVDVNIARVLSRLAEVKQPIDIPRGRKKLWDLAERFAGGINPRLSNAALMELGATLCSARNPQCGSCPVKTFCRAKDPLLLPRKKERRTIEPRCEEYFFALMDGHVLLEQRTERRWRGLWTLPILSKEPDSTGMETPGFPLVCLRHPITRFIVHLKVFRQDPPGRLNQGQEWKPLTSIEDLPMPSPHRRALKLALWQTSVRTAMPDFPLASPGQPRRLFGSHESLR